MGRPLIYMCTFKKDAMSRIRLFERDGIIGSATLELNQRSTPFVNHFDGQHARETSPFLVRYTSKIDALAVHLPRYGCSLGDR